MRDAVDLYSYLDRICYRGPADQTHDVLRKLP
ncbi:arylamine N-acetyltransferase, partial [Burkholderia pseudomallei]